ncbi:MAG: hypothetical protein HDR43_00135 [Mycoplasma sp.]|nr:hypothetical protein [Mycoplasma sp.]
MSEKNYYDELIEKIENFIKNNNKIGALKLIKEELSLPYVPKKYEEKLYVFLEQLEIKNESKKTSYFSRDELIQIIKEYKKHNIDFLLDISSKFDENNWIGYEKEINEIFNYDDLDKKVKSIIYNTLVLQNINYDFTIDKLIINPVKNKTIFETEFALQNLTNLSKQKYEDPSIFSISQKIFFIYLMNCFPNCLFFEFKDITKEIINISNVMLGIKDKKDLTKEETEIFTIINNK